MSTSDDAEYELVRVIFEAEGKVNLAQATGQYGDGAYYSVNVGDRDFNIEEEFLPEYLTEKLALLKLAQVNVQISGVGFKNRMLYAGAAAMFSVCDEVFYVDITSVGFKGLVAGCKVRRSNREVK